METVILLDDDVKVLEGLNYFSLFQMVKVFVEIFSYLKKFLKFTLVSSQCYIY